MEDVAYLRRNIGSHCQIIAFILFFNGFLPNEFCD